MSDPHDPVLSLDALLEEGVIEFEVERAQKPKGFELEIVGRRNYEVTKGRD